MGFVFVALFLSIVYLFSVDVTQISRSASAGSCATRLKCGCERQHQFSYTTVKLGVSLAVATYVHVCHTLSQCGSTTPVRSEYLETAMAASKETDRLNKVSSHGTVCCSTRAHSNALQTQWPAPLSPRHLLLSAQSPARRPALAVRTVRECHHPGPLARHIPIGVYNIRHS